LCFSLSYIMLNKIEHCCNLNLLCTGWYMKWSNIGSANKIFISITRLETIIQKGSPLHGHLFSVNEVFRMMAIMSVNFFICVQTLWTDSLMVSVYMFGFSWLSVSQFICVKPLWTFSFLYMCSTVVDWHFRSFIISAQLSSFFISCSCELPVSQFPYSCLALVNCQCRSFSVHFHCWQSQNVFIHVWCPEISVSHLFCLFSAPCGVSVWQLFNSCVSLLNYGATVSVMRFNSCELSVSQCPFMFGFCKQSVVQFSVCASSLYTFSLIHFQLICDSHSSTVLVFMFRSRKLSVSQIYLCC
jgi:hypothetical protein